MSQRKARKKRKVGSSVVLTVEELRVTLGIGRNAAYGLAKKLGVRIGTRERGRLLVPRTRLDEWLRGPAKAGAA